jgi:ribose/xylose/arabinose/galactoside ABC-type transport system permease subunit
MKQTRLRVVLIGLALGLIEGVAKVVFPAFPIVETFGFQAAIIGAYLTARTLSNIRGVSEENGNGEVKKPPPEIQL